MILSELIIIMLSELIIIMLSDLINIIFYFINIYLRANIYKVLKKPQMNTSFWSFLFEYLILNPYVGSVIMPIKFGRSTSKSFSVFHSFIKFIHDAHQLCVERNDTECVTLVIINITKNQLCLLEKRFPMEATPPWRCSLHSWKQGFNALADSAFS